MNASARVRVRFKVTVIFFFFFLRKNLDVSCLELVIGIATFVKIFSYFYTETTDIK